jgi:hypothetical protein
MSFYSTNVGPNVPLTPLVATATSSTNLGGPYQGYSPKQTILNYKDSENVMARRRLVKSWNTPYATGTYNGKGRVITPFRAVNNLGDFLSRKNYVCGGSNQVNKTFPGRQGAIGSIISHCDNTGVPASSGNMRFVPDASDYINYKKLKAMNQNYNDLTNGGDQNHGSYVARMAVHRF